MDEIYEFTTREKAFLGPLTLRNTKNKFFLATATEWNSQSTKIPFEWLVNGIDTYSDLGALTRDAVLGYQGDESTEYVKFAEKLMKGVDINISRFDLKVKKIPVFHNDPFSPPSLIINGQLLRPTEQTQLEVKTIHEIVDKESKEKKFCQLMLEEESKGTQLLFWFSPVLKKALAQGKTIIVDEIEQGIHPAAIKYIINLFRNSLSNQYGAQFILTTHCTNLLRLDIFRRDQIYLIEKDRNTAESKIHSLLDSSVRKDENIENGYLSGRYGAVPDIKEMILKHMEAIEYMDP